MQLEPVLMLPAYRSGRETPWGGEKLSEQYNKYALGTKIGESYELSLRDGLMNCSPDGRTLLALIDLYGADLLGTHVRKESILTIKLVDAKACQSVCICAQHKIVNESTDRKIGYIILHADDESRLVCGLTAGTTANMLEDALEQGCGIEPFLNVVPVDSGDSVVLSADGAHAVGAGILLYGVENFTASTYRLADWDAEKKNWCRKSAQFATAVQQLCLPKKEPVVICRKRSADHEDDIALDTPDFQVKRLRKAEGMAFTKSTEHYSVLTCLSPGEICLETGRMMYLTAGQTVLIPAMTCEFTFTCADALLAWPKV